MTSKTRRKLEWIALPIVLVGLAGLFFWPTEAATNPSPRDDATTKTVATLFQWMWPIFGVIAGLTILAIIVTGSFALARYRAENRKGAGTKDVQSPETSSKSSGKTSFPLVYPVTIGGYLCLLIGATYIWPAFWEWLWGQRFLCWWTIVVLPLLALAAAKFKSLWWLIVIGVIMVLLGADWLTIPNPYDWRLPTLEAAKKTAEERQAISATDTAKAGGEKSATTSKVITRTIVATVSGSEIVSIPASYRFRVTPRDCIEISTVSGKSYRNCPGEHLPLGDNVSLRDAMFRLKSLTGKEVEVVVEWEPK